MRVYLVKYGVAIGDATPHGMLAEKDPLAAGVVGATAATPIVITTDENHGLTTGDIVYLKEVLGVYQANGRHVVTVLSPTTFSLDGTTGTGTFIADGAGEIYLPVAGLDDLTLALTDLSLGEYSVEIAETFPLVAGDSLKFFLWDEGLYAGEYRQEFSVKVS